jgi:hypothetical protein
MTRENMIKDWIKGVSYSLIIPVIITVVTKLSIPYKSGHMY